LPLSLKRKNEARFPGVHLAVTSRSLRKILPFFSVPALFFMAMTGYAAVAPVAQLPTVTAGATPSPYVLPILLVNDQNEWKDFGIHVNLKVYGKAEEQAYSLVGNEWDVGVMDPFYAVKAGNDGDLAIVGLAGNLPNQLYLLTRKGISLGSRTQADQWLAVREILYPIPSGEHFYLTRFLGKSMENLRPDAPTLKTDPGEAFLKGRGEAALLRSPQAFLAMQQGFPAWPDLRRQEIFLPTCLVASASYADTRKTLVIRWLEGYARGIRILMKNPGKAASRLKVFYEETLKIEVPASLVEMEFAEAFFTEKKQEESLQSKGGNPSSVERFAYLMSDYQMKMKVLKSKRDPGEYILSKICEQLAALRGEADAQFKKTQTAIGQAEKEGIKVGDFRRQLNEARGQMEEGRGCLTVIGTLSNLMRGAEQAQVQAQRFKKFRLIEFGIGGLLVAYYVGYAARRRNKGRISFRQRDHRERCGRETGL
jgi:ABC-type nitrate/sulfonate/bicarbonate transport system substrate-binding protein